MFCQKQTRLSMSGGTCAGAGLTKSATGLRNSALKEALSVPVRELSRPREKWLKNRYK
jgi:hypothetical protein